MSTEATEAPPLNTDPAVLCGHTVNLAKSVKTCVKPLGHDNPASPFYGDFGKGHVSKIQRRKNYEPVSLASLDSFEDVDEDVEVAYGAVGAGEQDRSAMFGGLQPKIDDLVAANFAKWTAAGEPKEFNKAPRARFIIDASEEDSFRAMLRAAGRWHVVAIRMPGTLTPHENGKYILYWSAQKIQPRRAGDAAPAPNIQPSLTPVPETPTPTTAKRNTKK